MDTMITSGQKEHEIGLIVAAARKAGEEAIEELSQNGTLNRASFQRVFAQGNKLGAAVKAVVKATIVELAENIVGQLKRIFADSMIELDATNGVETIAGAKDVFTVGIYYAKERGPCKATPKMLAAVYEMIKGGTYAQIFGGFGENLKRLCFTESQIVAFCRKHRDKLCTRGYGTFFLFEGEEGGFFVASVLVRVGGGLRVYVRPLGDGSVWIAYCQDRIVVPQL